MKRFAIAAAVMLLCGPVWAQPPIEVPIDDTIDVDAGGQKVVQFNQSVKEIMISGADLVEVKPLSDRTFTVRGIRSGRVIATAIGSDGKLVHQFNIAVAGHLVKVYGQKPPITGIGKPGQEFDAFICTDTGCGRVNPDLVQGPSAVILSDTTQKGDGSSQTVTKEYR